MFAAPVLSPVHSPLPSSKWFTCPRPAPSAPLRLWCFPFAGGGAAVWHPWAKAVADIAEIVAVRPPGRETRFSEAPLVSLTVLVAAVVEHLAPFLHETYALCGHSLGGLAIFEVTRALRARGLPLPAALVVLGARAPHYTADRPLVHAMPHAAFVAEVERRYGAIPREIREHPDFLELLLPVLRADLQMFESYDYAPEPPLEVPIMALAGAKDPMVSRAQLLEWRAHTTETFEADLLPGGHFFLQEHRAVTIDRVRAFLRRVAAPLA